MTFNTWLALETSTDTLSIAVGRDGHIWHYTGAGAAQSSTDMIPQSLTLLEQAGLAVGDLQAVVFGRGPGAFTGLRTSCAVAQGLAFGANLRVLPIDTLLAVAEEAKHLRAESGQSTSRVLTVMDARMDQIYVAAYEYTGQWQCVQAPILQSPEELAAPLAWEGHDWVLAGNAHVAYGMRWPEAWKACSLRALPTATALLRLAPACWARGDAVAPEDALPLYVRDKVAQTTAERMQAKTSP